MTKDKKHRDSSAFTSENAEEMGEEYGHEGGESRREQIDSDSDQAYEELDREDSDNSRRGK